MPLSSVDIPEEGVQHVQKETVAYVDGRNQGKGSLYITENAVTWRDNEGQGFSLLYPSISLHAISRDLNAFEHECLFLMVDEKLTDSNEATDPGSGSDENEVIGPYEGDIPSSEVRFVPEDKGSLDAMFTAMSDCQQLHPDEQDSDIDDFCGDYFEGQEGIDELTEDGRATLQHLENLLINGHGDAPPTAQQNAESQNEDQFEDADDMQQ